MIVVLTIEKMDEEDILEYQVNVVYIVD